MLPFFGMMYGVGLILTGLTLYRTRLFREAHLVNVGATIFWPVCTAAMYGTYKHPFWSRINGSADAPVDLPLMFLMETTTSRSSWLGPTT